MALFGSDGPVPLVTVWGKVSLLVTVIVSPFFADSGFGSNAGLPCTFAPLKIVNGVPAAAVTAALAPVAFAGTDGALVAFALKEYYQLLLRHRHLQSVLVFQSYTDERYQ